MSRIYQNSWDSQVWQLVTCIPRGKVATYGQIAMLLGRGRWARHVGHALRKLPQGTKVPWHRVINGRGKVSLEPGSRTCHEQWVLLAREGVLPEHHGRISLDRFGWSP